MATLFEDITAPYSKMESWGYDHFIAPAVIAFADEVDILPAELSRRRGRLLDVGCGGGHLLEHLARRSDGIQLTGLDLSAEQVDRARRRLGRFGERVAVVEGSALAIPFEDDTFDAVVSVASIKHWPDAFAGLAECVRVLSPGGRLVVIEADRGCRLEDAARFVARWQLPAALQTLALAGFRTWVAGQSLDLDDARALAAGLPLSLCRVQRIVGTPAWLLDGVKRA